MATLFSIVSIGVILQISLLALVNKVWYKKFRFYRKDEKERKRIKENEWMYGIRIHFFAKQPELVC